jgi:hypothetical protein
MLKSRSWPASTLAFLRRTLRSRPSVGLWTRLQLALREVGTDLVFPEAPSLERWLELYGDWDTTSFRDLPTQNREFR